MHFGHYGRRASGERGCRMRLLLRHQAAAEHIAPGIDEDYTAGFIYR